MALDLNTKLQAQQVVVAELGPPEQTTGRGSQQRVQAPVLDEKGMFQSLPASGRGDTCVRCVGDRQGLVRGWWPWVGCELQVEACRLSIDYFLFIVQLTREGDKPPEEWTGEEADSPKTRAAWAIRRGKFVCDKEIWQTVTSKEVGEITSPAKKRRKVGTRKHQPRVEPTGSPVQVSPQQVPSSVPSTGGGPTGVTEGTTLVRSMRRRNESFCARVDARTILSVPQRLLEPLRPGLRESRFLPATHASMAPGATAPTRDRVYRVLSSLWRRGCMSRTGIRTRQVPRCVERGS